MNPKDDKQYVPCEGMDGKWGIWVVHSARIKKSEDTAKQPEVHKKCKQKLTDADVFYPGEQQTDVHGNAAQLKWEVPPVIAAIIYNKCQAELFPDFTCSHSKSAYEIKSVIFHQNSHLLSVMLCYNTIVVYMRYIEKNIAE